MNPNRFNNLYSYYAKQQADKKEEERLKQEQAQEDAYIQNKFNEASRQFDINNPAYEQTQAYKARKSILDDLYNQATGTGLTNLGQQALSNQETAFGNALTGTRSVASNQGTNAWNMLAQGGVDNNLSGVIANKYNQQGQMGQQENRLANQQAINTINAEDATRKQAYKDKAAGGYADLGQEASNYNQNLNLLKQATLYNTKAARGY